jgi:beta-glucosidase
MCGKTGCGLSWTGALALGIGVFLVGCTPRRPETQTHAPVQPVLGARSKAVLTVDGLRFRDLNGNGRLDPYEDWRLTARQRADDLVARMTLEEKAGTLMHGSLPSTAVDGVTGAGAAYDLPHATELIVARHVTSAITRLAVAPREFATQNNRLQEVAEGARLGIPLTISTDPRHHFQFTAGAAVAPSGFSQWPEMLGLAAIGDAALVRRFGDVARQEYRAVGLHMGLSPQADLATEPRWPRVTATFGEDATLAGRMVGAYVEGFQGGRTGVHRDSVALVVKHFAGYGAAKDGFDSHNRYGRFATFPGDNFDYHVAPFRSAFAAKVAGVMPTYSVFSDLRVNGQLVEQVGGGYNRWLLTDILRGREGFDGFVLSDWAITQDCGPLCRDGAAPGQKPTFAGISTAWGVESLSKPARFAKGLAAGLDQFGGTEESEFLMTAIEQGLVSEARIEASVHRVLQLKFELGLFENPYVDPAAAAARVGSAAFRAEGEAAQRRALVLLENRDGLLPLKGKAGKLYLVGVSAGVAKRAGFEVAATLEEASIAIIRAQAPHQLLHPGFAFGSVQHEGDLDFKAGDPTLATIQAAAARVPTIVTVMLDRPAILTNIKPLATALLGDFGVSDEALLDVIAGRAKPQGHLPFELPSSMEAVRAQKSDLPHDSPEPLYPFGYGLQYR